jgi:hypothetical protein
MKSRRPLRAELLEHRFLPTTFNLHQGDNLQATIDSAQPGDTILLDAGATFTGPITLDAKPIPVVNLPLISIATNDFPLGSGARVSPSDAVSMAKIVSPGADLPALQTQPDASDYDLRGLEIMPVDANAAVDTLVELGDGSPNQSAVTQQPRNILLDQCFIHGFDGQTLKRGVSLNDTGSTGHNGVVNSYLSNFKSTTQDTQAIAGWNGTGPYLIQNNYLEAAGENIQFGGSYSYIQETPSNVTISDNTFSKPLSWNPYDPSYAGTPWSVKNLLEFKNADTVTVQNNTFQNNWKQAQAGYSIVITPRASQSGGTWVTVSNVTITHNTINHVMSVFDILGSDDTDPSSNQATNITISNNLTGNDIGGSDWGGCATGTGRFMLLLAGLNGGTVNLQVLNNTILNAYATLVVSGTHTQFAWQNNIQPQGTFGMVVSGLGEGPRALAAALPQGLISNNVIVGARAVLYPASQAGFPPSWNNVGFVDYESHDTGTYLLAASSPFYVAGVGSTIAGFRTPLF